MADDPNERGAGRSRVKVDIKEAIKMLGGIEAIVSCEKKDLMRYGAQMMNDDIDRAFKTQSDPSTGRKWPERSGDYSWPILQHTGTLRGMVDAGWGVKTRSGKIKFFGRVRDGFYLGGYTRGGRQQHKPNIVVAGSVFWGRSKARTERGGKRWDVAPATGRVPPRPFIGYSRASRDKFKREIERQLRKAAA